MSDASNKSTPSGCGCLALCGLAAYFWFNCCGQTSDAERHKEAMQSQSIEAWVAATDVIQDKLLTPGHAKFPFGVPDGAVQRVGQNKFHIASYVDSQNAFGAELRTDWSADVEKSSATGNWSVYHVHMETRH